MFDRIPERTIWSIDRETRALIVRRRDGFFEIYEEYHCFDEDTDVWYWSTPMNRSGGIYQTADQAEKDVRLVPPYCPPDDPS
jgi:hypothetical protein